MDKFTRVTQKIPHFMRWLAYLLLGLLFPMASISADEYGRFFAGYTPLQAALDDIISHFRGYHVGVAIQSLTTGRILYQHHADHSFVPASTLKLFTGVAALDYLGPHYRFKTQFLKDQNANIVNGVLTGNLYVKFSGDPRLTVEDLKDMLDSLRRRRIRSIQGNVVIDDTVIDRSAWAPGRVIDDKIFCYAAPVTAIIIDRNCFSLSVKSNRRSAHPLVVKSNKALGVVIHNYAVTRRLKRTRYSLDLKPNALGSGNHYTLRGYLSPNMGPLSFAVALQNPNLATYDILASLLHRYSIRCKSISYGKTPALAETLAENRSPELAVLVRTMLKKSDNLIADSLLKKLGEKYFAGQGSWKTGCNAVRDILAKRTNIDFRHVILADGSGLSRDNIVTPNAFIQLLRFAYTDLSDSDLFFSSLPSSGRDGTLKHRLGGVVLGRIHAKTGSMHGISSLAGYIHTMNDKMLAFSILVNDSTPGKNNQDGYRRLENRICEFLARNAI